MADLSWRESITKVLDGSREPMHYTEVAAKIADQGLRTQVGATPAASVAAELSTSLKNEREKSPFERVSRGFYRLRHKPGDASLAPETEESEEDSLLEAGLINAFGMYWRRDHVVCGARRSFLDNNNPAARPLTSQTRGVSTFSTTGGRSCTSDVQPTSLSVSG